MRRSTSPPSAAPAAVPRLRRRVAMGRSRRSTSRAAPRCRPQRRRRTSRPGRLWWAHSQAVTKVCPYCAFDIPAVASRCGWCTADVTDAQRTAGVVLVDTES
jgi:hypothetical protein